MKLKYLFLLSIALHFLIEGAHSSQNPWDELGPVSQFLSTKKLVVEKIDISEKFMGTQVKGMYLLKDTNQKPIYFAKLINLDFQYYQEWENYESIKKLAEKDHELEDVCILPLEEFKFSGNKILQIMRYAGDSYWCDYGWEELLGKPNIIEEDIKALHQLTYKIGYKSGVIARNGIQPLDSDGSFCNNGTFRMNSSTGDIFFVDCGAFFSFGTKALDPDSSMLSYMAGFDGKHDSILHGFPFLNYIETRIEEKYSEKGKFKILNSAFNVEKGKKIKRMSSDLDLNQIEKTYCKDEKDESFLKELKILDSVSGYLEHFMSGFCQSYFDKMGELEKKHAIPESNV